MDFYVTFSLSRDRWGTAMLNLFQNFCIAKLLLSLRLFSNIFKGKYQLPLTCRHCSMCKTNRLHESPSSYILIEELRICLGRRFDTVRRGKHSLGYHFWATTMVKIIKQ